MTWTMVENNLPADVGFAPWSPARGSATTLSGNVMTLMNNVAGQELNQDFNAQTNLDSMYFSGKGLAKFASVVYAVRDLSKNPGLANAGLQKLKTAFDVFVQNRQRNPLNCKPHLFCPYSKPLGADVSVQTSLHGAVSSP